MACTPPIDPLIAALFQDSRRDPDTRAGDQERTTRTTFSVNREIHDALRLIAARHRCKLNDLIAIAVEDWLEVQGSLPSNISRADIRRRLTGL
jgi:hypothetical protein